MTEDDREEPQDSVQSNLHEGGYPAHDSPGPSLMTTDEAVAAGRPKALKPDETTIAETAHVTESSGILGPVPVGSMGGQQGKGDRSADRGENQGDGHHREKPQPARAGRPAWLSYVLTGVVAMACGVGGAWAFSHFSPSKDPSKQGDDSRKGDDDPSKTRAKVKEGDSGSMSAKDAEDGGPVKNQLENLTARFEVLRQRVEGMAMPRDTNPPDLAGLRVKVDELSRTSDDAKSLPGRFREVEGRMDRLQGELKGLRDQLVTDRERANLAAPPAAAAAGGPKVDAPARPAPPPPSTPSASPTPPDPAMAQGVALFKKGMYPQAEAIFRNLRTTRPQDARVWYYSALTNGFATGKWDGETRNFVIQGAERERAGLPPAPEIDSAFADLNSASGKDWLASYRSQLVKR